MSQRILFSDMEEGNHKDEDEDTVSRMEEEIVIELRRTKLIVRNSKRIERKLLKIVKVEVEKSHVDIEIQHTDEVLQ